MLGRRLLAVTCRHMTLLAVTCCHTSADQRVGDPLAVRSLERPLHDGRPDLPRSRARRRWPQIRRQLLECAAAAPCRCVVSSLKLPPPNKWCLTHDRYWRTPRGHTLGRRGPATCARSETYELHVTNSRLAQCTCTTSRDRSPRAATTRTTFSPRRLLAPPPCCLSALMVSSLPGGRPGKVCARAQHGDASSIRDTICLRMNFH